MNKNLRDLAWVEMKSTLRNYNRKTKASLIGIIIFFTTLMILESLNPYGSHASSKGILVISLVSMTMLYGICFDSLKRILDENVKLKEKSQTTGDSNR